MNSLAMLWARLQLLYPTWTAGLGQPRLTADERDVLDQRLRQGGPDFEPYERLGKIWHAYAATWVPDYPSFLRALSRQGSFPVRSVLDLACGAGSIASRLAASVEKVLAVDACETMLRQAQETCASQPNVRFARADFRSFSFGESFDAVLCASDSLNYVEQTSDLAQVFACVARHLNVGGFFLFDVWNEAGFRQLAGRKLYRSVGGISFCVSHQYDARSRRGESLTVFADGVERHRRIPIEPADVASHLAGTGMSVIDRFSHVLSWPGRPRGYREYYVLRRVPGEQREKP